MDHPNRPAKRAKIVHERREDPNVVIKRSESVNDNFISEDGVVKFDFMTSLENIAAAKVVVQLWMDPNILESIIKFIHSGPWGQTCSRKGSEAWKEIERNVLAVVSNLPLPNSVIGALSDMVPVVGHFILNWIAYNDEHILNSNAHSEHSAVDHISHLAWTARGSIDYAETARNMLADRNSPLSNCDKYKIACACCLEDEITALGVDIVHTSYLDGVRIEMHPMVYYWTLSHLYIPPYNNYDMMFNEMIFRYLIKSDGGISKTCNQVAVYHIWNKLNAENKERHMELLIRELADQDLMFSILSDMETDQQREIFRECSHFILINILNSSLWRKYFLPVALHILDLIQPFSYFKILLEIARRKATYREKNSYLHNEYKYFFKLLWEEGSSALKEFIVERVDYFQEFVAALSWESDMDVIKFMFNKLTTEEKEGRFFEFPYRCWFGYAKENRLDVLEHFLQSILTSGDDVRHFKTRMGKSVMGHLAEGILDDETDRILNWFFELEEQNEEARKHIACLKLRPIQESLFDSNEVDFTHFDKDLSWCARGDLEKINKWKSEFASLLFSTFGTKAVMLHFILAGKYEMLHQYLSWCFSDDRMKLAQFKSTACKEMDSGNPTLTTLCLRKMVLTLLFR